MNETQQNAPGRGSVALVTGATSGIGEDTARLLLEAGMTVHVAGRDPERLRATMQRFAAFEEAARPLLLDVVDPSSVARAAAEVETLDVLVHNAGINPSGQPTTETPVEVFRSTYETNVFAVVAVTTAFLPALRCSSHPRIVNVSSGTASLAWSTGDNPQFDWRAPRGGGAAYRSSKAALNALTVFLSQSLDEDRVLVNALAPGRRSTRLIAAAAGGGDPAEAAAGAVRLALLPDGGPTGEFFSWDGSSVPW